MEAVVYALTSAEMAKPSRAQNVNAARDVSSLGTSPAARDAQPALVIGRHYINERDSAPVQYNDIV